MIWNSDNSSLLLYKAKIEYGEILVGQELYQELCNLEDDLFHNDEYYYDTTAALLRMDFMQGCIRLTKSPYYGQPMVLMPWQCIFRPILGKQKSLCKKLLPAVSCPVLILPSRR